MIDGSVYDADYFLHGKQTGKSLYEDYRWLPELTLPMASRMAQYLSISYDHTILDFGCARGYTVRAFRELGYNARGVDASAWAITNCDPTVVNYVDTVIHDKDDVSWVIAKDVLEHVTELQGTISDLMAIARVGIFAVVPLSAVDGQRYVVGAYEKDITHIHRLTLPTWAAMFMQPGWTVTATYRVKGVKDNYWRPQYERGNGFITAKRIEGYSW